MKIIKTIAMAAVSVLAVPLCIFSCSAGKTLGNKTGGAVGTFTGSFDGVTVGLKEGTEAGRAEGLSANDTKASFKDKMDEVGKLEVLTAGVGIKNLHTVGEKYASIYVIKGNIIFSVDLTKAEFIENTSGNTLTIKLPQPQAELTINEEETVKLAQRQNKVFDGSAKDGYEEYLNTMKKTQSEMKEVIGNYAQLSEQARNSAQTQIGYIARQALLSDREIIFEFMDEGENDG